ncbi:MAG: hypothetical protein FJX57_06870, partial [Alphaproteobacteria bacterium]|nr:hypothetical protein [Alphaproteobacteria bacterium]
MVMALVPRCRSVAFRPGLCSDGKHKRGAAGIPVAGAGALRCPLRRLRTHPKGRSDRRDAAHDDRHARERQDLAPRCRDHAGHRLRRLLGRPRHRHADRPAFDARLREVGPRHDRHRHALRADCRALAHAAHRRCGAAACRSNGGVPPREHAREPAQGPHWDEPRDRADRDHRQRARGDRAGGHRSRPRSRSAVRALLRSEHTGTDLDPGLCLVVALLPAGRRGDGAVCALCRRRRAKRDRASVPRAREIQERLSERLDPPSRPSPVASLRGRESDCARDSGAPSAGAKRRRAGRGARRSGARQRQGLPPAKCKASAQRRCGTTRGRFRSARWRCYDRGAFHAEGTMSKLGIVLALGATLAVAAPAAAQQQQVLRVVPETLSRILDPHFTTSFTTRDFGYLVFDTLFAIDENFEPKPQMVERWDVSADKLTYAFTLRAGLTWHDGQPVTAADCVASLRRWASRDPMGQTLMRFVDRIEAIDASSFRIVLKERYGLVLDSLAKIGAPVPVMMPERIARTPGTEQVREIIGSGPYRFRVDQHEPGIKLVLERFAGYKPRAEAPSWASGAKLAKIERVEMIGMPDANTQVNALIAGEVDYLERIPADLLPLLTQRSGARGEVVSRYGFQAIMRMNHLQPPFDNAKARQAIA